MKLVHGMLVAAALAAGCADAGVVGDEEGDGDGTRALSGGLDYFYVTPAEPGSTAPLALRKANAVPGFLNGSAGLPVLPKVVLAGDAVVSQDDLAALFALPYSGHEHEVVALVGTRDASGVFGEPTREVVELYWPAQGLGVDAVAQKEALYQLRGRSGEAVKVRLVNEKDYAEKAARFGYGATGDAEGARAVVEGGGFFVGDARVECSGVIGFRKCGPTAVEVKAVFVRP